MVWHISSGNRSAGRHADAGVFLSNLIITDFLLLFPWETQVRCFVENVELMKTFAKKRRKEVRSTMGFYSKCSLREANGRARERERTREKSLVRAKGRFGSLHCVRNMKIELGPGHFIVPRAAYLKDKRSVFFYGLFNSSVNHLLVPLFRLNRQTYFARYLQAGHVTTIFISERYTSRNVHSVCPNNVAWKSRDVTFFTWWELYLFPLSSHSVIARRRFVRRRARELGRGTWTVELIRVVGNPDVCRHRPSKIELSLVLVSDF